MQTKKYFLKINLQSGAITTSNMEFVIGDNASYEIQYQIINGDFTNYDLTGCKVRLVCTNNVVHQQDCEILLPESGIGTIKLAQEMYDCAGQYLAEFQIYKSQDETCRLSTPRFKYTVRKSLQTPEAVEATNSFTILQQMINDVKNSHQVSGDALNKATEAKKLIDEKIPQINQASQNAQTALDRATNVVTQEDIQNHIRICDTIPQPAKVGQLFFIRKA